MITTSVNQNLTTINKFQAANKFGKMTGLFISRYTLTFWKKQKCLCEGDPELSMTRNCRVHCTHRTLHYTSNVPQQIFTLLFNLNYMHTLFKNTFRICFFTSLYIVFLRKLLQVHASDRFLEIV